jgi:alpha-ketoglutarate-dependent taurine dioxygenase
MEQSDSVNFSVAGFADLQPEPVSVPAGELVRTGTLDGKGPMPLVLEPNVENVDLPEWAKANSAMLQSRLVEHGALLFRGFPVDAAPTFERFALAVCDELYSDNGEHPRETVSGQVYTPVFYPANKHLLWHNENSFNQTWPSKIIFCCLKPAARGGETPIVDSRKVYQSIDPAIRERFERKGIMYMRNYSDGLGLNWQTVFRTKDRAEVEAYCRAHGFEFEWKTDDRFCTRCVRPAVIGHPRTGEMSWFNQAQHWHVSCLDPEVRNVLSSMFAEEDLPRNCYYGDGSLIEDSVMDEILRVYKNLEVSFPWRAGDIIVLDNILAAHARNQFEGERKLLVAMGDMSGY